MLLSRRNAAGNLLAFAAAALPLSRALAQPAPDAVTIADDAPTQFDTGRDAFEHMMAPVTINGQGPFQFLMDTGANVSCVSRELGQRLALPALPPARVHTVVGVRERAAGLDHFQEQMHRAEIVLRLEAVLGLANHLFRADVHAQPPGSGEPEIRFNLPAIA